MARRSASKAASATLPDDTRERLVAHALAAFARSGYEGLSLEDVAQKAGVRKATIFYHFESKAALYREVGTRVARAFAPLAEKLRAKPSPEGLDEVVGFLHDTLSENRDAAAVVWREALDGADGRSHGRAPLDDLFSGIAPLVEESERYVRRGQRLGVFTKDLKARQAVDAVAGAISMFFLNPRIFDRGLRGAKGLDDATVRAHREGLICFVRRALLANHRGGKR